MTKGKVLTTFAIIVAVTLLYQIFSSMGSLSRATRTKTRESHVIGTKTREFHVIGTKTRASHVIGTKTRELHVIGTKTRESHVIGTKTRELRASGKATRKQRPPITLFSAWSTFPERYKVFNNTLRNWLLLQPHVKLILFTNDFIPGLNEYEKLGWTVLPIFREIEGCVVMKDLFLRAMKIHPGSKLYALVNGDILFTDSFIKNLHEIMESPLLIDKTFFLTGRKLKIENFTREEASSWKNIEKAAKRGVLDNEMWGIDYYITPPSYHWQNFPDLQLWPSFYDNWLIWDARRRGYVVIDATNTLLAAHQNAPYPKDRGKLHNNLKYMTVSRDVLSNKGTIPCCEFHTVFVNHTVTVKKREKIPERCNL